MKHTPASGALGVLGAGILKERRGFRRFSFRGMAKVSMEWEVDLPDRLAEEPVKLSAGGIEGILLWLGAAAMDQQTTFVIDHIPENLSGVFPS